MTSTYDNWKNLCPVDETTPSGQPDVMLNSPGQMPTALVELSVSCRNLIDADIVSKSDPQCVVLMKSSYQDEYREFGRTEVIDDNLNPDFVKKFTVSYNFEMVQKIMFEIYDIDPVGRDFLGRMETTMAEIVAYRGRQFSRALTGVPNKKCGQIIIVVEELNTCKQIVSLKFNGYQIRKYCWLIPSDPFLKVWRSNEDGSFTVVHQTEMCRSTVSPMWKPMTLKCRTLCNGDFDRTVRIDCFDYRRNGDHKLLGSCFTNLNRLTKSRAEENKYDFVDQARRSDAPDRSAGVLQLVQVNLTEEITFLDYIRGGTEMHFAVAIDFTASNGDVRDPRSLHYIDQFSGQPNSYEIALRAVGDIIQHYDKHGLFPGFGFGAKLPPEWNVSHQFPLNGNESYPYCRGIQELVECYKRTLSTVQLYGPTNFAPVINSTANIAKQYQDGRNYFVLLIITDGVICDMEQTKYAVIAASLLPVSIIIVGVGNADFSAMDELDSDDVLLSVNNQKAYRDIVQFVPINKFLNRDRSVHSQAELAREVLFEIPDQILFYMKMKGFKPGTRGPGASATAPANASPMYGSMRSTH